MLKITPFNDNYIKWLIMVMAAILFASSWVLTAFFAQSRETAILSASPGALSYSLAVAATGVGDAKSVIVIQSIRLLSITTALPLVLDLLKLQFGAGQAASLPHIPFLATAARNFDNRLGDGAQVYLASTELTAISGLLGRLPEVSEYFDFLKRKSAENC